MFQNIICFLFGIYVGQEYGNTIPNVREKSIEVWKELERTKCFGLLKDIDKSKNS